MDNDDLICGKPKHVILFQSVKFWSTLLRKLSDGNIFLELKQKNFCRLTHIYIYITQISHTRHIKQNKTGTVCLPIKIVSGYFREY